MLWIEEWLKQLRTDMEALNEEAIKKDDEELHSLEESEKVIGRLSEDLIRFFVVSHNRRKERFYRLEELKKQSQPEYEKELARSEQENLLEKLLFQREIVEHFHLSTLPTAELRRGWNLIDTYEGSLAEAEDSLFGLMMAHEEEKIRTIPRYLPSW